MQHILMVQLVKLENLVLFLNNLCFGLLVRRNKTLSLWVLGSCDDHFYASVPDIARARGIMFLGCPSHSRERNISGML